MAVHFLTIQIYRIFNKILLFGGMWIFVFDIDKLHPNFLNYLYLCIFTMLHQYKPCTLLLHIYLLVIIIITNIWVRHYVTGTILSSLHNLLIFSLITTQWGWAYYYFIVEETGTERIMNVLKVTKVVSAFKPRKFRIPTTTTNTDIDRDTNVDALVIYSLCACFLYLELLKVKDPATCQ